MGLDDQPNQDVPRLYRNYTNKRQGFQKYLNVSFKNEEFPARAYAKKKLHRLSYLDKLKIVHNVLVNKETQKDTAKTFRVTPILVSTLILKVKKNPTFLEELKFEIESKQE